jgi:hypothetical protein
MPARFAILLMVVLSQPTERAIAVAFGFFRSASIMKARLSGDIVVLIVRKRGSADIADAISWLRTYNHVSKDIYNSYNVNTVVVT